MKGFCLLALFFVIGVGTGCKSVVEKKPEFDHFKISFEQDGLTADINNYEVRLNRKPFSIVISFIDADSIFVNASFKPGAYDAALLQKELDQLPGFKGPGIQEEMFNKESVLHVSDDSPNYWFYRGEGSHRFNEVVQNDGIITCKRKIDFISHDMIDDSKPKVAISDIKEESLYLVFIKLEWNDDYSKRIEKKRSVFRIVFL